MNGNACSFLSHAHSWSGKGDIAVQTGVRRIFFFAPKSTFLCAEISAMHTKNVMRAHTI